jgi:hypothetical protein
VVVTVGVLIVVVPPPPAVPAERLPMLTAPPRVVLPSVVRLNGPLTVLAKLAVPVPVLIAVLAPRTTALL